MSGEDDILQRIILEGAEEVRKELQSLGAEGEAALKKIEAAGAGDFAAGLRKISPEVKKFQDGMAAAEQAGSRLPGIFGKIATAIKGLNGSSSGINALTGPIGEVDKASSGATKSIRGMGIVLRALGRATGAHELGQLGSIIRSIGVNIELIAFPALLVGIGALARSAANATQVVQDLAFKAGELPETFSAAANAAVAVGGSTEKMGESLAKLPELIVKAAKTQEEAEKATRSYHEAIDNASDAIDSAKTVTSTFVNQQRTLIDSLVSGKIAGQDYRDAQKRLNDERAKANQALAKAYDAEVKLSYEYQRNKVLALENADALTKLGIAAQAFKRLNSVQREDALADALKNFSGDETERKALALELFGENARKLYPSLLKGAAGMAALRAESERIAPSFSTAQNAIGDKFTTALSQLGASIISLKNQLGITIAPAFLDFLNLLRDAFISARPAIISLGAAVGSVLKPLFEGLGIVLNSIVIPSFKFLAGMFDVIASGLNSIFGSNLTGAQVFTAVIVGLVAAFAPWVPIIVLAAKAVSDLWDQLKKIDWIGLAKPAIDFWNSLVKLVNDSAIGISNAFNTSIEFIKGLWESLKSTISGWASSAYNYVQSVIDRVKELASALASLAGISGGDAAGVAAGTSPALAGGGEVSGKGTARSDSIWARLSNGEFVIQAAAVGKYGTQFLHAINQMALAPRAFPGFNIGGLVDALAPIRYAPAYADGGTVRTRGPESILNLTIGQEAFFGLRAPEDTAAKLTKFAQRKGVRAAGRKPSWFGG